MCLTHICNIYWSMLYMPLHCSHNFVLQCVTRFCIAVCYTTLHCSVLHNLTLQCVTQPYIAVCYTTLHCSVLHDFVLQCVTQPYIAVCYTTLHCSVLHNLTLQCVTQPYIAVCSSAEFDRTRGLGEGLAVCQGRYLHLRLIVV